MTKDTLQLRPQHLFDVIRRVVKFSETSFGFQRSQTKGNWHLFFKLDSTSAKRFENLTKWDKILRTGLEVEVISPGDWVTISNKPFYGKVGPLPFLFDVVSTKELSKYIDSQGSTGKEKMPVNFIYSKVPFRIPVGKRHSVTRDWMLTSRIDPSVLWEIWATGLSEQKELESLSNWHKQHIGPLIRSTKDLEILDQTKKRCRGTKGESYERLASRIGSDTGNDKFMTQMTTDLLSDKSMTPMTNEVSLDETVNDKAVTQMTTDLLLADRIGDKVVTQMTKLVSEEELNESLSSFGKLSQLQQLVAKKFVESNGNVFWDQFSGRWYMRPMVLFFIPSQRTLERGNSCCKFWVCIWCRRDEVLWSAKDIDPSGLYGTTFL